MCGIGGILRTDGQPIPEEWLDAIDARIAYRGPDGHGRFRDRVEVEDASAPNGKRIVEVAFVHRRLSIIDHKDGAQPMVSERGRNDKEGLVAVVFNGCIYNHRELRKELEGKGHKFVTDHSDTEVLIHGWREWRTHLNEHLEGMYAYALWDKNYASLVLARDAFGEKPLYISQSHQDEASFKYSTDSIIIFGSDAGSVAQLSDQAISQYVDSDDVNTIDDLLGRGFCLLGICPSGNCLFESLSPRYMQGFDFGSGTSWGNSVDILTAERSNIDTNEIERLFSQAVERRLEADVPLGCFLSGGIDSSLVATFAKRHKPDLATFTVRVPDARYDESVYADSVAAHLHTNHVTLDVAMSPATDLIHLIEILGQPFGDSSILPTYWISRVVRQHAKVALSGDGGDELFVGYERYKAARLLRRWRYALYLVPSFAFRGAHPKSVWNKIGRLGDAARDYGRLEYLSLVTLFRPHEVFALIGEFPASPFPMLPDDPLSQLRKSDVFTYLPDDILRKVDTASMACGLEVRCPFLDRDLARAALSMPIEQLMPGGQRKGLLRNIARKYLPKEIVDRPKMGFAIPIGEWFRDDDLPHKGSGMKTLLLDHLNSTEPFGPIQLNRKAVQRFIDEHMSCKRDHGQRLFTLLTLSIWARMFAKTSSTAM